MISCFRKAESTHKGINMTMTGVFQQELDFFMARQDELVLAHRGKVLVIRGTQVVGVYSSPLEAYTEAQKSYQLGSFMIQRCDAGLGAFSATVSSACVIA